MGKAEESPSATAAAEGDEEAPTQHDIPYAVQGGTMSGAPPAFRTSRFHGSKETVGSVSVFSLGVSRYTFRMKLAVLLGLGFFLVPGLLMMGFGSRNVWRGVAI